MKKRHAGPITSPTPNQEAGRGQPAINTEDLHRRLDARDVDVLAVHPAAGYYAGPISVNRKTSTRCPPPPSVTARPKGSARLMRPGCAAPAISGSQAEGGQRSSASAPAAPGMSPRTSALGKTASEMHQNSPGVVEVARDPGQQRF